MTPVQVFLGAAWSTGLFVLGLWLGGARRRQGPSILPDPPQPNVYFQGYRDGVKVGMSRGIRHGIRLATGKVAEIADAAEKAARESRERHSLCGQDVAR